MLTQKEQDIRYAYLKYGLKFNMHEIYSINLNDGAYFNEDYQTWKSSVNLNEVGIRDHKPNPDNNPNQTMSSRMFDRQQDVNFRHNYNAKDGDSRSSYENEIKSATTIKDLIRTLKRFPGNINDGGNNNRVIRAVFDSQIKASPSELYDAIIRAGFNVRVDEFKAIALDHITRSDRWTNDERNDIRNMNIDKSRSQNLNTVESSNSKLKKDKKVIKESRSFLQYLNELTASDTKNILKEWGNGAQRMQWADDHISSLEKTGELSTHEGGISETWFKALASKKPIEFLEKLWDKTIKEQRFGGIDQYDGLHLFQQAYNLDGDQLGEYSYFIFNNIMGNKNEDKRNRFQTSVAEWLWEELGVTGEKLLKIMGRSLAFTAIDELDKYPMLIRFLTQNDETFTKDVIDKYVSYDRDY